MADRRPQNFGEVLFNALGSGLGAIPGAQEQQRGDKLTAFMTMLQAQQAEREKNMYQLRMAQGRQAMRESDIKIQSLIDESNKTPEQRAAEKAAETIAYIEKLSTVTPPPGMGITNIGPSGIEFAPDPSVKWNAGADLYKQKGILPPGFSMPNTGGSIKPDIETAKLRVGVIDDELNPIDNRIKEINKYLDYNNAGLADLNALRIEKQRLMDKRDKLVQEKRDLVNNIGSGNGGVDTEELKKLLEKL